MDAPDLLAAQAASFGAAAQVYERSRPPYPDQALDWLLPSNAQSVLDLGAGTGQVARQLQRRGLSVVAVEPSLGMRNELVRVLPDVPALSGSAEEIPLPDSSVDAVLVAQAWHWVDVAKAVPEVARVLKPGGQLGLLWNIRDERKDWVAKLGHLMHQGIEQPMNSDSPVVGRPFGPIERLDIAWTHQMTRDAVVDLVASRSYVITLPEREHEALLRAVRYLLDTDRQLRDLDFIDMPYVTQCSRVKVLAEQPDR